MRYLVFVIRDSEKKPHNIVVIRRQKANNNIMNWIYWFYNDMRHTEPRTYLYLIHVLLGVNFE